MLNEITCLRVISLSLLIMFGLVACVNETGQKQTIGTILGGGLGAIAGSNVGSGKGQLAAVAIGTLLGAYAGSEVGKSLDKVDQLYAEKAYKQAQTTGLGESVAWNNPDSGHSGTVTAIRDGKQEGTGAYCREFRTEVSIGGKVEEAYGSACRQPDGSWKIVQ